MNRLEEGINCYLSGDTNSAIKLLKDYLKDNPSAQGYYYLGLAYSDIGKHTEAGSFFQEAIKLEPEKGIYHYRLAIVYERMMLFHQAIPHLEKTIAQNPEHVRAHFILGSIYMKNGDLQSAAERFRAVTRISPNYADGYHELGNSLYYAGDAAPAKEMYEKVLKLDPEHMDSHYKLGLIYSDEKMYDKALYHYDKAHAAGTGDMIFMTHYILTLADAGKKDRALQMLTELAEANPASREVARLKDALAE